MKRGLPFLVIGSALAAGTLFAVPAQATPDDHQVTICHGAVDHYELITVDEHALAGHFDGADPAHGWQNLPDHYPSVDGTCDGGTGPL